MPIFDYICNHCSHGFEAISLGTITEVKCPKCFSNSIETMPVSLFNCMGVQLTKRLKLQSELRLEKGHETMKGEGFRKRRIKIL